MSADLHPTTWRVTPVCATEDMRRSAAHILRLYVDIDLDVAMVVAGKMWEAMSSKAPPPLPIENDPEVGDRKDG